MILSYTFFFPLKMIYKFSLKNKRYNVFNKYCKKKINKNKEKEKILNPYFK